jgi:hypothetical protein
LKGTGPPRKRKGRLHAASPELTTTRSSIPGDCQQRWEAEANRLLKQFELTGDLRHLSAYKKHIAAMHVARLEGSA